MRKFLWIFKNTHTHYALTLNTFWGDVEHLNDFSHIDRIALTSNTTNKCDLYTNADNAYIFLRWGGVNGNCYPVLDFKCMGLEYESQTLTKMDH